MRLLLDEHISPRVAINLRRGRSVDVLAMSEWEGGSFLGSDDAHHLRQATMQGLTLVTYDQKTIRPLLSEWGETGQHHAGVIFVDEKTIFPNDIRGLIRGLALVIKSYGSQSWIDRVVFLQRG